jgi:hypothetical protein
MILGVSIVKVVNIGELKKKNERPVARGNEREYLNHYLQRKASSLNSSFY